MSHVSYLLSLDHDSSNSSTSLQLQTIDHHVFIVSHLLMPYFPPYCVNSSHYILSFAFCLNVLVLCLFIGKATVLSNLFSASVPLEVNGAREK